MSTEMLQYESAIIDEILLAMSDNVLHPEFPNRYTPSSVILLHIFLAIDKMLGFMAFLVSPLKLHVACLD